MFADPRLDILGAIILLSYTTQAISGFGSIVIAVTLGAFLFDIAEMLPVLVPLNIVLNLWLVGKHARHIERKLLFWRILPIMGGGLLIGILIFEYVQGETLKQALAVLIVFLASLELLRVLSSRENTALKLLNYIPIPVWILLSGITHGMYASGGPFLVYALGRLELSKAIFRATLVAVWLIFNGVLTVQYLFNGRIGNFEWLQILIYTPLVILGIVIGEWAHHRVNERHFRILVFTLLLFAGGVLVLKSFQIM